MTALTATWAEAEHLDAAETILVGGWRYFLERGQTAEFVAGLIATAVGFEPRFGLAMDTCERHGCSVFVDERARDERGHLHCSDGCRDADSEDAFERAQAAGYRDGLDVRPAGPADAWFGRRSA